MIDKLTFFLKSYLKQQRYQLVRKISGFTLLELLVAMILAALVITPLLGFMINILDTDRKEQAKSNSEQEVQAALEYIARDLQQAAYIYDATGVASIQNKIPPGSAAVGDCNTANCAPVLVFWKRRLLSKADVVGTPQVRVGTVTREDDTYVYSLVAYYSIKDNNSGTWSKSARIARFEIRDGILDANGTNFTAVVPDKGFQLFDLKAGNDISAVMNQWKTPLNTGKYPDAGSPYVSTSMNVLVDYIDDTPNSAWDLPNSPLVLPINKDLTQAILDCRDPQKGGAGGDLTIATNPGAQRVPADLSVTGLSSFYACVNSKSNTARVYIRGNGLARIDNNHAATANNLTFFPTADVRVVGRGALSTGR